MLPRRVGAKAGSPRTEHRCFGCSPRTLLLAAWLLLLGALVVTQRAGKLTGWPPSLHMMTERNRLETKHGRVGLEAVPAGLEDSKRIQRADKDGSHHAGAAEASAAAAAAATSAEAGDADEAAAAAEEAAAEREEQEAEERQPEVPPWYADTPYDLVFAWYNHTDPKRTELIRKYNPGGPDAHTYGTEPNRGELYLSLASAHHFARWVRRIYIVVPPGQGDGLRLKELLAPELVGKIEVVEETAFVPNELLPVFSSIVVEAFLHRIPGISEHFLYMMDDVLFGKPFTRGLAFSDKPGVGNVFLMDWLYVTEKPTSDHWSQIWRWPFYNTGQLLQRKFEEPTQRLGWHAGYALSKTAYNVAWSLFEEELNTTATHRFRVYKPWDQGGDLVAHLLVQHTAIRMGIQELVLSYEVPWNRGTNSMGYLRLPKSAHGRKYATFATPDCTALWGLTKDMVQKETYGRGVTFANLNKVQHTKEDGWRKLCSEAVEILADGFHPQAVERGCLCDSPTVGGTC